MKNTGNINEIAIVTIESFCSDNDLKLICRNSSNKIKINDVNINRPGLLLSGFEKYFANNRIQVIGNAEFVYLSNLDFDKRVSKIENLFSNSIPCLIYSNNVEPSNEIINLAMIYDIPVLVSQKTTSDLVNDLTSYVNELLAPETNCHGVLVEVSGIGVLLTGNSGMGKSETALELIHRGHRLVADDNVILKRVKNNIIGLSPEKIRFLMEIRGIGIIDARNMFGVSSVLIEKSIDLVIEFEKWEINSSIDRLCNEQSYENILDVQIPKLKIPVMAGRNLAIIVEVAARNFRLKKMGYDPLEQLLNKK